MNHRYLSAAVLIGDLACSLAAMLGAILLRYGTSAGRIEIESVLSLLPFALVTCAIWIVLSLCIPLHGFRGGWSLSAVVAQLLPFVTGLMLILLSGGYLFRTYVSRLVLAEFGFLLFGGFILVRVVGYLVLRSRSRKGLARRVVIVGRERLARELGRKIERHPEMLCTVVGFLAPGESSGEQPITEVASAKSLSTSALGVVDLLSEQNIDELIVVLQECASPDLLNLTASCRGRGIRVSVVPQFYELYLSRPQLTDLDGLPVLQFGESGYSAAGLICKRSLDLLFGILLSVPAICLLTPIVIALSYSRGKAFRWETRCGFRGKRFQMLRLNVDRDARHGTRTEQLLSRLSLTELPQLLNVLKGDMSLVGPRPESTDRVCRYSEWQQQRLTVKPGMTGLAQVHGLRDQHSSEEKTRFDLQYLVHPSFWTDLSLLLQTLWTLATRSTRWDTTASDVLPVGTAYRLIQTSMKAEIVENANRP